VEIISLKNKDNKLFYYFAFENTVLGCQYVLKHMKNIFIYKVKTALLSKVLVL